MVRMQNSLLLLLVVTSNGRRAVPEDGDSIHRGQEKGSQQPEKAVTTSVYFPILPFHLKGFDHSKQEPKLDNKIRDMPETTSKSTTTTVRLPLAKHRETGRHESHHGKQIVTDPPGQSYLTDSYYYLHDVTPASPQAKKLSHETSHKDDKVPSSTLHHKFEFGSKHFVDDDHDFATPTESSINRIPTTAIAASKQTEQPHSKFHLATSTTRTPQKLFSSRHKTSKSKGVRRGESTSGPQKGPFPSRFRTNQSHHANVKLPSDVQLSKPIVNFSQQSNSSNVYSLPKGKEWHTHQRYTSSSLVTYPPGHYLSPMPHSAFPSLKIHLKSVKSNRMIFNSKQNPIPATFQSKSSPKSVLPSQSRKKTFSLRHNPHKMASSSPMRIYTASRSQTTPLISSTHIKRLQSSFATFEYPRLNKEEVLLSRGPRKYEGPSLYQSNSSHRNKTSSKNIRKVFSNRARKLPTTVAPINKNIRTKLLHGPLSRENPLIYQKNKPPIRKISVNISSLKKPGVFGGRLSSDLTSKRPFSKATSFTSPVYRTSTKTYRAPSSLYTVQDRNKTEIHLDFIQSDRNIYVPSEYEKGRGIPGKAGVDYPINHIIPQTDFSCRSQDHPGLYADTEAQCQVFHICQADGRQDSFLCPNGTVFNQKYFVCDWWYKFLCLTATTFYHLNALIYESPLTA